MGAQDVQEQSATPTLTYGGMPASPHRPDSAAEHDRPDGRCEADHGWPCARIASRLDEWGLGVLIALVLICSAAADARDCTRGNANTVMRVPAEFGNPVTCFMHAQT